MKIVIFDVREDEKPHFELFKHKNEVDLVFSTKHLTLESLDFAKGAQAVSILGHSSIGEEIFSKMKDLGINALSTRTIGYNHIDIQAAQKFGIKICNASYGPNGVADYTVMLILMSLRKYKQALFRGNVNDYSLKGLQGREMKDMTIGVIGTGNIGAQVIHNLSGFGCRMLAFDTRQNPSIESFAQYVDLEELYAQADIITYHVPLLDSTRQMINIRTIQQMRKGVIIVNCSRGELMNISDIIAGIESESIGALGLDVFDGEEGIYHYDRRTDIISNRDMAYLRQFPNVTMTQHMAFYTDAAVADMVRIGVESLIDVHTKGSHARLIC